MNRSSLAKLPRHRRAARATASFVLGLTLFALAGCGDGNDDFVVAGTSNSPGVNTLRVVDTTPDARFQGAAQPVAQVEATGFDAAGNVVFGPDEETYDEEMVFTGLPESTTRVRLDYNRGQGYTLARHEQEINFASLAESEVTLNEVAPQALAEERSTFTVRVANTSQYPDDQVFITVLGKNPEKTAFYYVKFGAGDNNSSELFGGLSASASYSQQLSLLKKVDENVYSFQCPKQNLISGRIYLSFGKKLQDLGLNDPNQPLSLRLPSATGLPDAQTVYEFMELSATTQPSAPQDYTLFANTSVVDFFSVGLGMTMDYHQGGNNLSDTVGFVDGARDKILVEFEKSSTPPEFRNYIRRDGGQAVLRVLAPVQKVTLEPDGALAHFLDSAIDAGWAHYASVTLNILDNLPGFNPYGYKYSGQPITNGILSMTCTAKPSADVAGGVLESLGEVCNLPKPTSRIVFFCDDNQSPPLKAPDKDTYRNAGSDGHKRLVSLIGAALNRGVFENYADWSDSSKFYTRADGKFNHFAKIMHQFALDNKVYGFGYDDVYGQDPTLAHPLDDVNQVVITIPDVPVL